MKRYLLFAGACYCPAGGWSDFDSSHDTVFEAKARLIDMRRDARYDWWQIVDGETGTMVEEGGS